MYPFYRYMDQYPPQSSYSRPREPNHYPYSYYPNWENSFLPRARADSSKPPSAFEPWPPHYDAAFSHPSPTEPHSSCSHSYPPGYYSYRPPFPHMQPPPQIYYHGPYPPYFAPLPHYDWARYDPDKPKGHCCGCPNHTCHPNRNGLKIEEQKNESEPDETDPSSRLIQHPSYPHPVMWIPPGYTKDMENDKNSGWVPLDMNTLKSLRQGEEKKDRHPDKEMQLPWPIIWMPPGNEKPGDSIKDLKEVNDSAKSAEASPSKVQIVPLKLLEGEKSWEKPGDVGDLPTKKQSRTKTIPVVQAEQANNTKPCVVEKLKEKGGEKKSTVSGSQDGGVKKACESKQQSPMKSSKLPPVCLRLDPLPKKKSVSGASKPPSPPGCKAERTTQDSKDQAPATKKNVDIDVKLPKQDVASVVAEEKAGRDAEKYGVEKKVDADNSESKEGEQGKARGRVLLQSDAAVIIQSAYRGWEVRRWQPLEKLRKIAQIREQVASVKKQVEGLGSVQQEMKQRVIISETIMNLLLQLDTIQGLHPSVREIRKALARDLTCLQEKLDCLGSQVIGLNEPTNINGIPCHKNSSDESVGGISSSPTIVTAAENSPVQPVGNDGEEVEESESDQKRQEAIPEHSVGTLPDNAATDTSLQEPLQEFAPDAETRTSDEMVHVLEEVNNHEEKCSLETAPENEALDLGLQGCLLSSAVKVCDPDAETGESEEVVRGMEDVSNQGEENSLEISLHNESLDLGLQELPGRMSSAVKDDGPDAETGGSEIVCILEPLEKSEGGVNNQEEKLSVELLPENADISLNAQEILQESSCLVSAAVKDGAEAEIEVSGETVQRLDRTLEQSQLERSNQEGVVPSLVEANNLEEAPLVLKAEEPKLMVSTGEHPEDSTVEDESVSGGQMCPLQSAKYDTKQEEFQMMQSVEDNTHGDNNERMVEEEQETPETVGKTLDTEVPELVEKEKDSQLEEVSNETVEALVSEAPPESSIENADDEDLKDVRDAAVQLDDATPMPRVEMATDAHRLKDDAPNHPEDISPFGGLIVNLTSEERKLVEENAKLRVMLEKLMEAGKQQLGVISDLNGRVQDLEKKLVRRKSVRVKRGKLGKASYQ